MVIKSDMMMSLSQMEDIGCHFSWRLCLDYDADAGDLVNYNKLPVCQFLCSLAPAGTYRNWKIVIFHLGERRICN